MIKKRVNQIRELLITEASFAQKMLEKSIQGLLKRDTSLLHEVIEKDEPIMNSMDVQMDKLCTQVAALYQLGPKELRFILSTLKTNYDLERIGDHAVNIAESSIKVIPYGLEELESIVSKISDETMSMLNDAVNSFVNEDEALAYDVLKRDDIVDHLRDECMKIFSEKIKEKPEMSPIYLELVRVIRSLERVADLSTNIAEYTIFVKKAELAKHGKEEQL